MGEILESNQNQDPIAIWSENYSDKYRSKRNTEDDSYNYIENPMLKCMGFSI